VGLEQRHLLTCRYLIMRLVFTLLVIIVVIGFIYAYRTDVQIDDNLIKGISQIRHQFGDKSDEATTTKIYKRRNAKGEWVFTNEPPPAGKEGQVLEYRSDTNVMPAPEKDKKEKEKKEEKKK
jgi:hypothetical protein